MGLIIKYTGLTINYMGFLYFQGTPILRVVPPPTHLLSSCSVQCLHLSSTALNSQPRIDDDNDTNRSQLVAPHMLNSFGHLIGSPNEDRLRTFHHNLRHGCQTKLTSLHKNKVEPTVLAAVRRCSAPNKAKKQDAINKMLTTRCKHESLYRLTFFLTYLLPFFLTYLFTFFLTYLLTFFLTSF